MCCFSSGCLIHNAALCPGGNDALPYSHFSAACILSPHKEACSQELLASKGQIWRSKAQQQSALPSDCMHHQSPPMVLLLLQGAASPFAASKSPFGILALCQVLLSLLSCLHGVNANNVYDFPLLTRKIALRTLTKDRWQVRLQICIEYAMANLCCS